MDVRIIFLCALIFSLGGAADEPKKEKKVRGKIVGGTAIQHSAAPYQVSLVQALKEHFCGGSIIAASWILTAAHCVEGMRASSLTVRSGATETNKGGIVTPVARIISHPRYSKTTVDNDIALLQLSRPIPNAQPIQLAHEETPSGSWCLTTGYGAEDESASKPSKTLQYVWTPLVAWESCAMVYKNLNTITKNMMCCGWKEGGYDACQGDSGGPMVANNKQAGITSWGKGCARKGTPGVYTNVWRYIPWIRSVTNIAV